ncbi:MAG: molybdopterin molybdotransferase MoeA [Clostridia bacterium]
MDFFNVMTLDNAKKQVMSRLNYLNKSQNISLQKSLNKILFIDIVATENLPSFCKSTVDGYAVRAEDTYGATESSPTLLKLLGSVVMGKPASDVVSSGKTQYVPTGGMLPSGADSAIMIENTDLFNDNVAILKSVHLRENTLNIGEDVAKGSIVANKGDKITPLKIGVLAGLGVCNVTVYNDISVYIISTGDELIDISSPAEDGKVRDINSFVLESLAKNSGFRVCGISRVLDDFDALVSAILNATKVADIVLVSGGSSVGEKDFTYRAIKRFNNDVFIKGISLKPGKPTIVGSANGKLVFGLPGHPMASAIVYKMLVERAIYESRGQPFLPKFFAETSVNFPSSSGRTTCQPVKCAFENGKVLAVPLFGKSGIISSLDEADGIVVIPDNVEGINKNQVVAVFGIID